MGMLQHKRATLFFKLTLTDDRNPSLIRFDSKFVDIAILNRMQQAKSAKARYSKDFIFENCHNLNRIAIDAVFSSWRTSCQ